jgi:AraC-like DNA-binding protein
VALTSYQPEIRILTVMACQLSRWGMDDMRAPYWRLYVNRGSGAAVVLEGREIPITPGSLVAIPPETPCASRLTAPVHHTYIHFVARPPFAALPRRVYTWPLEPDLRRQVEALVARLVHADERDVQVAMTAQLLATWALCHLPSSDLRLDRRDPRIDRVLAMMEDETDAAWSNADLARIAGMHPAAFARRFRQVTGTTPQAMMLSRRVERAANLLVHGDGEVTAVAEETGFCDRAPFSRVFKKLRGMGPAAFRDLMRADRSGRRGPR